MTEYREWIDANPLRRWRADQNMTLAEAGVLFQVSSNTILRWEQGAMQPELDRMATMQLIIKGSFLTDWRTWWNERPRPASC
jgi:transcriptional regulator with XRE-family HTH domain